MSFLKKIHLLRVKFYCSSLLEKYSKTTITIAIPENFRLRRAAVLSIDLLIAGRWESAQKLSKTVSFLKISKNFPKFLCFKLLIPNFFEHFDFQKSREKIWTFFFEKHFRQEKIKKMLMRFFLS